MINPAFLATDELYYADKDYMSVSLFKRFMKCEEGAFVPFSPTSSMLVGSYVDAYISGTLDAFVEEHKDELISSRGATKGELKSDFKKAEEICRFIDNDKRLQQFLSGDKQTVMTGELFGVPWKIKMDIYSEHIAINDFKCMYTVTNSKGEYYDFISPWGYDIQMAAYQEIVRQNTGEVLPTYICAVTKETPIDSIIVKIPDHVLYRAMCKIEEFAPRFYDVWIGKEQPTRCECCDHCKETKKVTKIIRMEDLM